MHAVHLSGPTYELNFAFAQQIEWLLSTDSIVFAEEEYELSPWRRVAMRRETSMCAAGRSDE